MFMSTYKLPCPRNYWTEKISIITDSFTVKRFEGLRSSIHLNVSVGTATTTEESGKKVKPLIDRINARLNLLEPNKELCIDEMMIQSKSSLVLGYTRKANYIHGVISYMLYQTHLQLHTTCICILVPFHKSVTIQI